MAINSSRTKKTTLALNNAGKNNTPRWVKYLSFGIKTFCASTIIAVTSDEAIQHKTLIVIIISFVAAIAEAMEMFIGEEKLGGDAI